MQMGKDILRKRMQNQRLKEWPFQKMKVGVECFKFIVSKL